MLQCVVVLTEFVVALAAEVPVLGDGLRFGVRIRLRVELDGHGEVRDGPSEITLALVYTSFAVISCCQVYNSHYV